MAEHDENDEHDEHAADAGRGEGSVKRVDDPPTLPPFASDGPRPATIHGFPAVDVFGDGGLGDLFDVPKLGARPESAPAPKAAPPRLPPLASRGLKAPPTGPVPIIPPTGPVPIIPPSAAAPQSPVASPPVAKTSTSDARSNAPTVREPTLGPQPHDLADDSNTELAEREPAKPTSLPPAMSLIEKIRAAKRKEAEQADAAEGDAKPKPEPKPAAAKVEPRPAPTQAPGGRPPPPKPPSSVTVAGESKPASTAAEPRPAPPKPPASTVAAKPAPPKPPSPTLTRAEPSPAIAEPSPAIAESTSVAEPTPETAEPQAPAAEGDKVWLEPVPLLSLDRRHEAQAITPPTADAPPTVDATATADAPTIDTPPSSTAPATQSNSIEPPTADTSRSPEPEPEPEPKLDEDDSEPTVVSVKPTGRVGTPHLAPRATKPVLAPPPTTSAGHDEHQPKVGAPYVPPALVLDRSEDPLASEGVASEEPHPPELDTESTRPRAALPIPGSRRPPVDPMNPILAARLAAGTSEAVPHVHVDADASAESDAIPEQVAAQDTASLVRGLADEIIAEQQVEPAANSNALEDATTLELEPKPKPESTDRRRKLALYFLGVAAVLSLIVALLPSNDAANETAPTPEVAQAPEVEPSPGEPTLLAEAQPPEPVPVPVPVPQEPVPATDAGADTDDEQPEPTPVASTKPKPKPTKPEPEPEPVAKPAPEPAPKPEPKPAPTTTTPTPGGPDDKRSADELYDAAKAAYNSGRAAEAYKLAYASWRKKDKSKTAELMTLAACKLKDKTKAKSSLDKVTALRRSAIKKDCQGLGLSL